MSLINKHYCILLANLTNAARLVKVQNRLINYFNSNLVVAFKVSETAVG